MNRRDSIIKDNSEKEFNMNFQEIMEANHNATTREEQKKGRSYLLKMYVKIAQETAKDEQLRLPQGLTFLEYEELVSIGIIAIQSYDQTNADAQRNFHHRKFRYFRAVFIE